MGDRSEMYTVDDALISMGFGKFQVLILLYSGMAYAAEAMEIMILSFIGSAVQSEWNLSPHENSIISSVVFAGMLVGAYSWGVVSDNYGRRMGFLFTALVTSGAGFLSAFVPNYISLVILRFLVGVGLGGGPVLFAWFLEFVPTPNRGAWMVIFSFFWSIGTILEASLGWAVMPTLGWRWLLALSSLPSFMLLLFYGVTPESPRYLCMKGRKADAMHVLESIARMNKQVLPSGELVSEHSSGLVSDHKGKPDEFDEHSNDSQNTHSEQIRRNEASFSRSFASKIRCIGVLNTLLSRKLIRATLLLWMGFFGNSFAYYGVILLTSGLSDGDENCRNIKLHDGSDEETNLFKDVFITSLAEVPGLILSGVIVDRIGRKLSVVFMLFATSAFLMPLVYQQKEAITITLLFFARILITGSITTLSIYAPEVYPTSVRSSGYGIASAVSRIGGIISPLVAVALVNGCHKVEAILLFEVVIIISAITVSFFPHETKGRNLKDSMESLPS